MTIQCYKTSTLRYFSAARDMLALQENIQSSLPLPAELCTSVQWFESLHYKVSHFYTIARIPTNSPWQTRGPLARILEPWGHIKSDNFSAVISPPLTSVSNCTSSILGHGSASWASGIVRALSVSPKYSNMDRNFFRTRVFPAGTSRSVPLDLEQTGD